MTTHDIIWPILRDTYGKGQMVRNLADCLEQGIDGARGFRYGRRSREYNVMQTCWNWFPGGDTAAATARKIETALKQYGRSGS